MSDKKIAHDCALNILETFKDYQTRFKQITQRARNRFMKRQWPAMKADAIERLDLYTVTVNTLESEIRKNLDERIDDKQLWEMIKKTYLENISSDKAPELARTFFNSMTRRIFTTIGVDQRIEFTADEYHITTLPHERPIYKAYHSQNELAVLIENIFNDYGFRPEVLREKDVIDRILKSILTYLNDKQVSLEEVRFEMHEHVFYRGQGAFLIGRIVSKNRIIPIVMALIHPEDGLKMDAVLLGVSSVRILFSFTRSAFHVFSENPGETVKFLKTILDTKPKAEIYSSIGFYKHGKTLLYRDLDRHTQECTTDRFEISAGKPGMVMIVFDMANNNMVLKLIRDQFKNPKTTTRRQVMEQYDFVFKHYRVGRLIEAQPFEYLVFDICWFSEGLLEELEKEASKTVQIKNDRVIIRHAYVERRVTPLDIFLENATSDDAAKTVIDFGNAIKDLAFSNVFPGDVLLKNFGVTRHGRVVFYDYDEIVPVTKCNFREIPKPRNEMEEMASEPWYFVAENDVFPKELARFLGLPTYLKKIFMEHHQDLFGINFWINIQKEILTGNLRHIPPYSPKYCVN